MKLSTLATSTCLLAASIFSTQLAAEGQADRLNENSGFTNLDRMIDQVQNLYGPTAAGTTSNYDDSMPELKTYGDYGVVHEGQWISEDMLNSMTAHERKRAVFGSNN